MAGASHAPARQLLAMFKPGLDVPMEICSPAYRSHLKSMHWAGTCHKNASRTCTDSDRTALEAVSRWLPSGSQRCSPAGTAAAPARPPRPFLAALLAAVRSMDT